MPIVSKNRDAEVVFREREPVNRRDDGIRNDVNEFQESTSLTQRSYQNHPQNAPTPIQNGGNSELPEILNPALVIVFSIMLLPISLERPVLALFALTSTCIVASIFITGICYFQKLHITQTGRSTFSGCIIFVVACFLVIGLSIYCAWIYDRIHYRFLLTAGILFSIGIGILAYSVFHMNTTVLSFVEAVWDDVGNEGTEALEKWFGCVGFDVSSLDAGAGNSTVDCAVVIKEFINKKTKLVATVLGGLFVPYLVFSVYLCYYAVKRAPGQGFDAEGTTGLVDLHEELIGDRAAGGEDGQTKTLF
jgi:hypothetical protein